MTLRLILGRSGQGKTSFIHNEIEQNVVDFPHRKTIIIVPDQMTHQTEYSLISRPQFPGMLGTEVLSFSRLALRIMQGTSGAEQPFINETGVHMLLRQCFEKVKDDLLVYHSSISKHGFIQDVYAFFQELKRYQMTADDVSAYEMSAEERADTWQGQRLLNKKINDLAKMYSGLEKALQGHYTDAEDLLRMAAEQLQLSSMFQDTHIYVDGFNEFTPLESQLLLALIKGSARFSIAFTMEGDPELPPEHSSMFRKTHAAVYKLLEEARSEGIAIEEPVKLHKSFYEDAGLRHLEAHLNTLPIQPFHQSTNISVRGAVSRRAEVEACAREILSLVRDEAYRYKDIAVISRDMDAYAHLLKNTFEELDIPFFIDQKRTMLSHPLIEYIRSALEVVETGWRYEAVFRCVKTGLLIEHCPTVDQLENHVLAYGIYGSKRWGQHWEYRRYRGATGGVQTDEEVQHENRLNTVRKQIYSRLIQLDDDLKKAKTVKERCIAVFEFLEQTEVVKTLEKLAEQDEDSGDMVKAREHQQAWQAIIDLFDQLVETSGQEGMSLSLFKEVTLSGLESLNFALVPPAVDQVIVATLDQSRVTGIQAAFVLGVNDGVLPLNVQESSLLSEEEREHLQEEGFSLAPSSRQRMADETFMAYTAFTKASAKLYVTYPLADEEGKTLMPSQWIARLNEMFPTTKSERIIVGDPSEDLPEAQMNYIVRPRQALSLLATQLSHAKRGYPVHDTWWAAYNFFMQHEEWQVLSRMILQSLFFENEAKRLTKETSRQLYGDKIQTSVSRMETFQACSFSHFSGYGLGLKERAVFRLGAPDIGELFHSAIKEMNVFLQNNKKSWSDLADKECEELASNTVEKLAPRIQKEILLSSSRHLYVLKKLKSIVSRTAMVLRSHQQQSGFVPFKNEVGFGPGEEIDSPIFTLSNGVKMQLVGRIDQVDIARTDQGPLLRVIDYKSSARGLSLAEVYYGLSLQMLVYLDVIVSEAVQWLDEKSALPAGMLYFHIHNPLVSGSYNDSRETIEEKVLEQFRMKGYMLADDTVASMMDQSVQQSEKSKIAPFKRKKDGGFDAYSSVISTENMTTLRKYARFLMKRIGLQITEGQTTISPYVYKNQTPCTYCAFKKVCQVDESLAENKARLLFPDKDANVIHHMIEQLGEEGGEENE
ncbi:helicase-exonuclease AddAB subunit AddB [Bacillaceae bacterium SIJ1]|uniref:helicase-exonuclease AddAB subunit AddB n=1 Tax=Litoribacterium kuwaitense TaxID=1398745 RepID=UPI0013EA1E68|nr:helicase-exonuclease AddAB subunit AddB [Litoribacterium kuwaitense]NGP44510.1 helicase-exonuclease AddAB subunit AddB [Litoribacterium kuwaitense]